MRCLMCNAEMVLIGAVPADATLPGFDTTILVLGLQRN
jgi:hypothetical protein